MTLPIGWKIEPLGEITLDLQTGFASGKHNKDGVGVPHIRPMNITRDGRLSFDDVKHVVDTSDRRLQRGDVLFNNTNSPVLVGKTTLIDVDRELAFSNHMTRIRLTQDVNSRFVVAQFNKLWSDGFFEEICSNHVNQASVATRRLAEVEVVLAPLPEQHRIVEILEEQFSRLDAALASIRAVREKAGQFRRSLLQAAFSGALTGHADRGTGSVTLTAGWRCTTFKDLGRVNYGKSLDTALRKSQGRYPVTGSSGVMAFTDVALTNEPTIVVGRKGNVGSAQLFLDGCWPIDTTYFISVPEGFNPLFLKWQLDSAELRKLDSSTAVPSLRRADLEAVDLVAPPLPEQHRIVEILEEQFSRLDAALAIADKLEARIATERRSLLHAAFTGELTAQWRATHG